MSKRPPRYRIVTDSPDSHRGIKCQAAATSRTWGSSTSYSRRAADTWCDTLRWRGMLAAVVPMMPVSAGAS